MENEKKYLVSSGDADEEYGLFIMEADEAMLEKEMYLAYFFDEDRFTHIKRQELSLFVTPSKLKSCTDEFGSEFTGKALGLRVKEAIKAFEEELPGWQQYVEETDERFSSLE